MAIAEAINLQEPIAAAEPQRFRVARTLLRKKIAVFSLAFICLFYLCGVFAPLVAINNPNENHLTVADRNAGPSSEHWLGQDSLGRDLYARIVYATRTTAAFTIVVVLTGGLFLGVGLGLLSGYRGGWVDTTILRVGEVLGAIPTLILILAITAAFRSRLTQLSFDLADNTFLNVEDARMIVQFTLLVGATVPFAWIGTSRLIRSQVLALREQSFVEAAEAMGASTPRILFQHIMPAILPLWMVGVSAGMGGIALAEVALSFLGLGISDPTPSFGTLVAQGAGARVFNTHPHLLLAPAIPVIVFVLCWNLLGDALVDVLTPRSQTRG